MARRGFIWYYEDDDDDRSDPRLEVPTSESGGTYRQNRRCRYRWVEAEGPAGISSCLRGFAVIYRYYAALYRRYCEEGRLKPKQLDLIKALMIDGVSLRDYARAQGVAPQAISARIDALANKAPAFCQYWRYVNARRQRRRKD